MLTIYKITPNTVVDFAAEELKKYLRMMMPEAGDIAIVYAFGAPVQENGICLGVMSDFSLDTSDAADVELDDILYIDVDGAQNGVIAGSNPRSVLLAVYRYLRESGCRFLLPGVDGEYIPVCTPPAVKYRKMADCRVRGWCNEGAEFQQSMLAAIDLAPKLGMNVFMTEFVNPKAYYNSYYDHWNNVNREKEPVSADTTLQWKRACECEMQRRGLQFHDVGHGWTADPFGIDSSEGWAKRDESIIPEGARQYLAEIGGRRGFYKGSPLVTQFCMSNPEARHIVARSVANYAENHRNVDYLHVWLADFWNNQCECEVCRTKLPSDWYIALMNDIDAELTARDLPTRIVFICYTETIFAAKDIKLEKPERFTMLFAPITRQYYESVPREVPAMEKMTYKLNDLRFPDSAGEYLMYGGECRDTYRVRSFVYEYHFTFNQCRNPGCMDYARIIHEDIKAYRHHGYEGIIEDGSQRSFFPNGFLLHVYAETLFDTAAHFDALVQDYYSHAYGERWREVVALMERLGKCLPIKYLAGKARIDRDYNRLYHPAFTEGALALGRTEGEAIAFAHAGRVQPYRVQSVCFQLLEKYLRFWEGISHPIALMSTGKARKKAALAYHDFFDAWGKEEEAIQLYYEHCNFHNAFGAPFFYDTRDQIPEDTSPTVQADTVGGIPQN